MTYDNDTWKEAAHYAAEAINAYERSLALSGTSLDEVENELGVWKLGERAMQAWQATNNGQVITDSVLRRAIQENIHDYFLTR